MSWVKGHVSRDPNRYLLSSLGRKSSTSSYSYKRLFSSVFAWIFAGAMIYVALPYAMAFKPNSAVGVSQFKQIGMGDDVKGLQKYSRVIIQRFRQRPVYLRTGQKLTAYYSLPKGAKITLHVRQCKNQPVIEVFSCTVVNEKAIPLRSRTNGSYPFTAKTAGMYYFTETVVLPDKNLGQRHENYQILWRRN